MLNLDEKRKITLTTINKNKEEYSMNESVIQIKDFRKIYGDLVAVDGISFEVQRGEIFGLLGPNGAGKTSTLESLEGP
jgi:ABC-2 type transport system ATP-binding protein